MAINIDTLISRGASAFTKISGSQNQDIKGSATLSKFIEKLGSYGTLVKARFEVSFSGIDDLTFFISDINIPTVRLNMGNLSFNAQTVEVPINYEFEHDFSMTVINDAKGMLYTTLLNWIMTVEGDSVIDSGYTMIVRSLGDGQNTHGIVFTLNGVRFKNLTGLSYSSQDTGISTFQLNASAINFTATMGGTISKIGGYVGAAQDILGLFGYSASASGL